MVFQFATGTLFAADKFFVGASKSNGDSWNVAGNWSPSGVPSGTDNVLITNKTSGFTVTADQNTPAYTGNLFITTNATLQLGYGGSGGQTYTNAMGSGGSTVITMGPNSTFWMRGAYSPKIPQMILQGDIKIIIGSSTSGSPTPISSYGISGTYSITLAGKSGASWTLDTTANTFSNLYTRVEYGDSFTINANVAGALGIGDVTIRASPSGTISANLVLGATNAIASTATLTLNGSASATKLKLTANNTVKRLVIDGAELPPGIYGKTGSGAQYQVGWINSTSTGTLTVSGAPSQYWDSDGATSGAGGATPVGTWDPSATSNWNSDSTGGAGGSVSTWTAGRQAVFAAGTDATGAYSVTVSGTPDIGGLSFEEGTVTLSSGGLRIVSDSLVNVATGVTAEVATPISNDVARQLSKVGPGTLILSGNSTYTGSTRVSGGMLTVASLANAGSNSSIGNYPTSGAGGLLLDSGTFQYTGGTVSINRGFTVRGNSTIDVSTSGTSLTMGNCESMDQLCTLTVMGGAGSTLTIGQARIVEAAQLTLNPTSSSMTVGSVNGYTSYGQSSTITFGGTTSNNVVTGTINQSDPPGSAFSQPIYVIKNGTSGWTISGAFSTGGSLTINNGALTLSGANSYSGATTVNGGTLIAGRNAPSGANGAFGNATSEISLGTAGGNTDAAILIGGAYTVGRIIRNATANNTDSGTRTLTLGGSTATNSTFSGNIFLGSTDQTSKGLNLTAEAGGQATFSGVIQEGGGSRTQAETNSAVALNSITKVGPGKVVLSNVNTYWGKTVVNEGTLALGVNNALPATAMTIGSATFDVATYTNSLGTLDVTGSAVINLGSSGAAVAFANSSAVDWTGGTLAITGSFVKNSSIRFGTDNTGLTKDQLKAISVTGYPSVNLDSNGYLQPSAGTLILLR
jgi:fibronectin-binding autotransporter adhesin